MYSSPALFSDPGELDFGFDSGIEAEMDEPNGKIIHMLFTSWEVCIGKNLEFKKDGAVFSL